MERVGYCGGNNCGGNTRVYTRTAGAAVAECSGVSSVARGAEADLNGGRALSSSSSTLREGAFTMYGSLWYGGRGAIVVPAYPNPPFLEGDVSRFFFCASQPHTHTHKSARRVLPATESTQMCVPSPPHSLSSADLYVWGMHRRPCARTS